MRYFLAVDLQSKPRMEAARAQKKFSALDSLRIVKPDNLHVTLKFLGNIDEPVKDKLVQLVSAALKNERSFTARLKGCGVYPKPSFPRVVWLDIDDKGRTAALQARIDKAVSQLGFRLERGFAPHVTIARVKSQRARDDIMRAVKSLESFKGSPFTVSEVRLKASTLTPLGPVYSTVKVFKLKQD